MESYHDISMRPHALRTLHLLLAIVCAMAALDPGGSRADVVRRDATWAAGSHDGSGSDPDSGWQVLAILGEPGTVSLAGSERFGRGPCPAGERFERIPRPRQAVRALDPWRCGAFAPGERPAALAFLRANGSANANGAGT